ncbi:MAG TPA: CRISPR-associated helicase/endonuclease Cas3 [Myxococcales bacterium]|nr:CRISPR-associated helicase/endonuclease Cas3 [Deltaproteobacteria bacterium]HAA54642.1 CRISPR-associated helicase/endonuclease Cas3 [Myxococcales bacterium]
MEYTEFFRTITGHDPYPYQQELATNVWPELLDIPTGLGKTAAVLLAWFFKHHQKDTNNPKRLVYCLPMRSLVRQTHDVAKDWFEKAVDVGLISEEEKPLVSIMMGGEIDDKWLTQNERPALLIGTQDILLSRALNRGYAMGPYRWPMHFGWLNNDVMWVFDETQLIGVGIETGAQLQAFRQKMGAFGPTHTMWMSATLDTHQIETIDYKKPHGEYTSVCLSENDLTIAQVQARVGARKKIQRLDDVVFGYSKKDERKQYTIDLANKIKELHKDGHFTLVVLNRVDRAQGVYKALKAHFDEGKLALIHSRFRPYERRALESSLFPEKRKAEIVVATQAIEAGLDISADMMITELAMWPSLVQRFGRCNREGGKNTHASIYWIDLNTDKDTIDALKKEENTLRGESLPYTLEEMFVARHLLEKLGDDAGPGSLKAIADTYNPPKVYRPVLRRKDLLALFDTTPDLCGDQLDISGYIRDEEDTDVRFYWRDFKEAPSKEECLQPVRDELCAVSIGAAKDFLKSLKEADAWTWDYLDKEWRGVAPDWTPKEGYTKLQPGMTIMLRQRAGGYDASLGWTGEKPKKGAPAVELVSLEDAKRFNGMDDDHDTSTSRPNKKGCWLSLTEHLDDVVKALEDILPHFGHLDELEPYKYALKRSAQWHDVGKAHHVFQDRLLSPFRGDDKTELEPPPESGEGIFWAKSNHHRGNTSRKYFRHELASALAWLQDEQETEKKDLIAYLIASHHGKIRLSLRALPGENVPTDDTCLYARGVWDGDELPAGIVLPAINGLCEGRTLESFKLDLSVMKMGAGSWLERMLALRDDAELGPFRMAFLETILRLSDWEGSANACKEKETPCK